MSGVLHSFMSITRNGRKCWNMRLMGSGFFGIAPSLSAKISIGTVKKHIEGDTKLNEVIFCLLDPREMEPYEKELDSVA